MSKKKRVRAKHAKRKQREREADIAREENEARESEEEIITVIPEAQSDSVTTQTVDEQPLAERNEDEEPSDEITEITDEPRDIKDISYGTSRRIIRIALTYAVTLALCAGIVGGAYRLAISAPSDIERTDAALASLREDENYKKLQSEKESLEYEVEKLRTSTENKKKNVDGVNDGDNTKAELRSQIEEKRNEYVSLSKEIKAKEEELAQLNTETEKSRASIVTLSPGTHTVGKQIAAGKYNITGTGKFVLAKDGKNLQNTVLSATPLEVTLEDGSIIEIDATTKFTPAD